MATINESDLDSVDESGVPDAGWPTGDGKLNDVLIGLPVIRYKIGYLYGDLVHEVISISDCSAIDIVNLTESSYRWRNDDGDEDDATWIASENTGVTKASGGTARLRIQIDSIAGVTGKSFMIEYRYKPSGGEFGGWKGVS